MTGPLPGLSRKVALVTGGASGIGVGIVRVLASQGDPRRVAGTAYEPLDIPPEWSRR